MSNPVPNSGSNPPDAQPELSTSRHSLGDFFSGSAPLAEQSVARDVQETGDTYSPIEPADADNENADDFDVGASLSRTTSRQAAMGYALASSYTRPSFIASGPSRSTFLPAVYTRESTYITPNEQDAVMEEERSLLRDNNIILPKHPRRSSTAGSQSSIGQKAGSLISSMRRRSVKVDEEAVETQEASVNEQTPLIPDQPIADETLPYGGQDSPEEIERKWEEAVASGSITTTWLREAKVIGRYSRTLIVTFLLQYSLTVCSVFAVGRIGTIELGAVSLGSMTANITGYAFFQGLATSLDTLCAQAYGSGHKKLVGLQTQRMVLFLWIIFIPVAVVWLCAEPILGAIVPEKETARLAALYLKILLIGAPAFAAYEAGKRFVQAQGLFPATLYVLLFVAPLNAFLHWFLVWYMELGFIGAPISVAISENLMPICLALYVRFVAGSECWGGFSSQAFKNWWPMVKLALPGLAMTLAEYLAFEILTLGAGWLGPTYLAAQSVLSTVCILTYRIPFPISIASSTRIANLIGATLVDAARTTAKAATCIAVCVGLVNMILIFSLRFYIPQLFTDDQDVIDLVAHVLPVCAAFQLFDALAANFNGVLRGLGRQDIGGIVSLLCFYGCALPISFGLGFGAKIGLVGLWTGPAIGVGLVSIVEGIFIYRSNWQKAVDAAQLRNATA